jgi:excinuclease ABC subunit C
VSDLSQTDPDRFAHVRETLRTLPGLPGVYRMMGAEDATLYVGKAKDLKKRVGSYFNKTGHGPRIAMMISQVLRIETTVTRSEAEALILENNFIKSLEPRFNVVFRDDKSYPYLLFTSHKFPLIKFFRGKPDKKARVFGPYPSAWAVRAGIQLLQKTFQLRTCEDSVFSNRSRPCMQHQIERCSAPCVGKVSPQDYETDVIQAVELLNGQGEALIEQLTAQMHAFAEALEFEKAARARNKIARLRSLQQKQFVSSTSDRDVDVVAAVSAGGVLAVNLTVIRGGQHVGDKTLFPKHASADEETSLADVLLAFCAHHYIDRAVPPAIIVNIAFDFGPLSEVLASQRGAAVQMSANVIGERRVWLKMAERNAELAIAQRIAQSATQDQRLAAFIEALQLPETTKRIECFDISHTQGEATVASCVVFDDGKMQTAQYRQFNVNPAVGGDDYAAMREALTRRCARIAAAEVPKPDVMIIDGGKGQVGIAAQVLFEAGLTDIVLFGSAKGVERKKGQEQIVFPDRDEVMRLPADHPGLHLIQSIQDEAHRFAVQGHRARRAKARRVSELDEIEGIGPKRRQDLMTHFGGMRGVQRASADDLARVPGISSDLAQRIYDALHA